MKKNISAPERVFRIILALTIGVLYLGDKITGFSAAVLGIIALVLFFTGLSGYCPLYKILKRTRKKSGE